MSYKQISDLLEKNIREENISLLTRTDVGTVKAIKANVDLEKRMAGLGYERYMERDESLKARGKHGETGAMIGFVYQTIKPVAKAILEHIEENPRAQESKLLKEYDEHALALASIRIVIMSASKPEDRLMFQTACIMLMQKLTHDMEPTLAVKCGRVVLECLTKVHGDMFEKSLVRDDKPPFHNIHVLTLTDKFFEWEKEHTQELAEMSIMFRPMVVPPRPWDGLQRGGYYDESLQRPFIRNRRKLPLRLYSPKAIPQVYEAVNKVQATPFRINQFVFETALAIESQYDENPTDFAHKKFLQPEPKPPHNRYPKDIRAAIEKDMEYLGLNQEAFKLAQEMDLYNNDGKKKPKKDRITFGRWVRERLAKIDEGQNLLAKKRLEKNREDLIEYLKWKKHLTSVKSKNRLILTTLETAKDYAHYPAIYFPHNIDWRGRIYPMTAGLTTQGVGLQKAILTFAHGKPIGSERALEHLMVHLANCWDYDKESWDFRLKWAGEESTQAMVKRIAEDPVGTYHEWKDADTPWLFIAACNAMNEFYKHGLDAIVDIPVPMDGTCNGAQHYAAITRDSKGAYGVNVKPNGTEGLRDRLAELRATL